MNAEATTAPVDLEIRLECGGCGYDLRGADDRCPECGRRFNRAQLLDARVPWEQRRYTGRIHEYVRTVYLATFRPWLLAKKVAMPVSYHSAKVFRRTTLIVAFVPILVIGLWMRTTIQQSHDTDAVSLLFLNYFSLAAGIIGVACALGCSIALGSWPFYGRRISRQQRDRAIALSYYACAPLAVGPLIVLVITGVCIGGAALLFHGNFSAIALIEFTRWPWPAAPFVLLIFLPWLNSTLWILRGSTGSGLFKLVVAGSVLPIAWLATLTVLPAVFVLVCAFLISIVRSFL